MNRGPLPSHILSPSPHLGPITLSLCLTQFLCSCLGQKEPTVHGLAGRLLSSALGEDVWDRLPGVWP